MKMRSTRMKKNSQSNRGDSNTLTSLDENLWSILEHHIDLAENMFSKLPFEEFFHLHAVCKDWYIIVCKRLGLMELIRKPFFNLFTKGEDGQLDGILIYNALSQSLDWRPSWTYNHSFDFVVSEGVVYSAHDMSLGNYADAFHWQSQIYQHLDLPPTKSSVQMTFIRIYKHLQEDDSWDDRT